MSKSVQEVVLKGSLSDLKYAMEYEIRKAEMINTYHDISLYLDRDKRNVLHLAVLSKNYEKVKYMLTHCPRVVYKKDVYNFTPFMLAVIFDLDEIAELFLSYYPELLLQNGGEGNKYSVWQLAVLNNAKKVVSLFVVNYTNYYVKNYIKYFPVLTPKHKESIRNPEQNLLEPLKEAVLTGDLFGLQRNIWKYKQLVTSFNVSSIRFENSLSLLHLSVIYNQIELVKYILKTYPNSINDWDITGRNALMIAIAYNKVEIADYILATYPLTLDLINKEGNSLLHYAVLYSSTDFAKKILALKPSIINIVNFKKESAFALACKYQVTSMINLLKEYGAENNIIYSSSYKNYEDLEEKSFTYFYEDKIQLQLIQLS
jgi:ankyrin repeat protein